MTRSPLWKNKSCGWSSSPPDPLPTPKAALLLQPLLLQPTRSPFPSGAQCTTPTALAGCRMQICRERQNAAGVVLVPHPPQRALYRHPLPLMRMVGGRRIQFEATILSPPSFQLWPSDSFVFWGVGFHVLSLYPHWLDTRKLGSSRFIAARRVMLNPIFSYQEKLIGVAPGNIHAQARSRSPPLERVSTFGLDPRGHELRADHRLSRWWPDGPQRKHYQVVPPSTFWVQSAKR